MVSKSASISLSTLVLCAGIVGSIACGDDARTGTPFPDAGNVIRDGGSTVRDSGSTVRDSGLIVRDSGRIVTDGGGFVLDSGSGGTDAGSFDAGPAGTAKIGEACTRDLDCSDPAGATCYTNFFGTTLAGGYCGATCTTEGATTAECGGEGKCAHVVPFVGSALNVCMFPCSEDSDCRTSENYGCAVIPGNTGTSEGKFCIPEEIYLPFTDAGV